MQLIAVVPAYEPPGSFAAEAEKLLQIVDRLIVVNDGNAACYDPVFTKIAGLDRTTVLSHKQNRGKGYALKTAFQYCSANFSADDIVVTADCDGQHAIGDIQAVAKTAQANPDAYVLGTRNFSQTHVPGRNRVGNAAMLCLLRILYGMQISDSQTGLRAFSVKTASRLASVKGDRFEYETGLLIYAKRNHVPIVEVPILTMYPENKQERATHFRTVRDSMRLAGALLGGLSSSILSGVLAAVTDIGLFSLLIYVLLPEISPGYTMLATIAGRTASSLVNFYVNNKYVFHGTAKRSVVRFYVIWFMQLILSYLSLYLFGHICGGHLTLVKTIADMLLALFTYQLQCNWVYEPPKERIYGSYGRFARWVFRTFSGKYRCDFGMPQEPVVFLCRHLNMHGPYTTLKWLPFELHPMIIHLFFDKKTTVEHMRTYTLAGRYGRKAKRFSVAAYIMGCITPPLMKSLQAVPVYRESLKSMTTIKQGMKYLCKGESLIVYPDIHYTDGYDQTSDIYDGFLYFGELYRKRTGKKLQFIPLRIDDEKRLITAGKPISIWDYRAERSKAVEHLMREINWNSTCATESLP